MSAQSLLDGLDKEQKEAVTLKGNGIVTAGAGSGKTKVLASRYVWLIMKGYRPEEILTLTFTNKAVSEMYSRIYRFLLDQADSGADLPDKENKAGEALKNFYRARISTLDSFSSVIARTAASRYGINPDFKSDDAALRDLAREAALQFVLDNRDIPAVRSLLSDYKIRSLAEELFLPVISNHSPVSSPPDFAAFLQVQKETARKAWREKTRLLDQAVGIIDRTLRDPGGTKTRKYVFIEALLEIFRTKPPPPPDIDPLLEEVQGEWDITPPHPETRRLVREYATYYAAFLGVRIPGKYDADYLELVENLRMIKGRKENGLFHELEAIANFCLNYNLCAGIYRLFEKFQKEFNVKKRESGLLNFKDIAHLAVDALRDHPDIRKVYKDSFRMIMTDEFQDNNALQRDLIFFLVENSGRTEPGVPAPAELEKDRMFFVGDEKQSIYRFRGADVAVFRTLGQVLVPGESASGPNDMAANGNISLIHNYRSRPGLIAAFNYIFPRVFAAPAKAAAEYEAVYIPVFPPEHDVGRDNVFREKDEPLVHFCFLDGGGFAKDDPAGLRHQDLEAVFIAEKIRSMVSKKEEIPRRTANGIEWQSCTWGDFAVLERSYTHQGILEKYFREFGIPYNTDRPSGLFNDAPILDMRAYLRLLAYPEDRVAYAALIRSPFVRLSDLSLAVCMLGANTAGKSPEPFAREIEELIPQEERALYRRAGEQYRSLREASRKLSVAELITRLWFEEGYRHETLWTESAQVYENLFDLFFDMASDYDARGKNLADFVEYLDDIMNREEKPDDRDIPGEGESGVKIMSIHKAKGLEFPVVFVFDCTGAGNSRRFWGLVNFHDQYGFLLDLPRAGELPLGGNYFRVIVEEEEKLKAAAELRRLLYVAMTRAECRLFLTFTLEGQTKEEKKIFDVGEKNFDEEIIRLRLAQLKEKYERSAAEQGSSEQTYDSFLKLLLSPLTGSASPFFTIEPVPVLSRPEISRLAAGAAKIEVGQYRESPPVSRQKEAALLAASFYDNAKILPEGTTRPVTVDASGLRCKPSLETAGPLPGDTGGPDPVGLILEKAGLENKDFGTLVHTILEARLGGAAYYVPRKIFSRVDNEKTLENLNNIGSAMADSFLGSELGKRLWASKNRKSEYPVITSALIEKKIVIVTGTMDLLFEEDDEIVVVDFKTDRLENPMEHYGQLAAYYRAAGDIFNKPVSVWLFYLRTGRAVNTTEEVKKISLEDLVTRYMETNL